MPRGSTSERIDALFDLLMDRPDGVTIDEIVEELRLPDHSSARHVIREFRLVFGESDVNLVANPQGKGKRWNYSLVGTPEAAQQWAHNRIRDAETRLQTMAAVARSIVNATDGRTVDGRKARLMESTLTYLSTQLGNIE